MFVKGVPEGEEVRKAVEFVLAFEHFARLVCGMDIVALTVVAGSQFARWWRLEGVAVGALNHILRLRVDGAQNQILYALVLLR